MLVLDRCCSFLLKATQHDWSRHRLDTSSSRQMVEEQGADRLLTPTQLLLTRLGRLLAEHPPSGPRDEVVSLLEALSSLEVRM
jgi:hypothetical protein